VARPAPSSSSTTAIHKPTTTSHPHPPPLACTNGHRRPSSALDGRLDHPRHPSTRLPASAVSWSGSALPHGRRPTASGKLLREYPCLPEPRSSQSHTNTRQGPRSARAAVARGGGKAAAYGRRASSVTLDSPRRAGAGQGSTTAACHRGPRPLRAGRPPSPSSAVGPLPHRPQSTTPQRPCAPAWPAGLVGAGGPAEVVFPLPPTRPQAHKRRRRLRRRRTAPARPAKPAARPLTAPPRSVRATARTSPLQELIK
jgi:hypothetical protein